MKRFSIETKNKRVIEAVLLAEQLLNWDSELIRFIYDSNRFRFNSGTGPEIAKKLNRGPGKPVPVGTFTYWNPFSAMVGRFYKGKIQVNNKKLATMSDVEILANILHEYSHACGFTHGDNYPSEEKNLYSVPYYLSENIGAWL